MNEYIKLLAEIDFFGLLFSIVTIAIVVVAGRDLIEKFCDAIGIEFSWIRKRREVDAYRLQVKEDLENLQKRQAQFEKEHKEAIAAREVFNKEMIDNLASLKNDIDALGKDIEVREAEKHFKKIRFDLLNFADRIVASDRISDELISQIFSEIKTYHDLVDEYGFENGRVTASIAVIQKKYEELLAAGRVVKGDVIIPKNSESNNS